MQTLEVRHDELRRDMAELAVKLANTREELSRAAREHEDTKSRLLQAEARAVRTHPPAFPRVRGSCNLGVPCIRPRLSALGFASPQAAASAESACAQIAQSGHIRSSAVAEARESELTTQLAKDREDRRRAEVRVLPA